MALVNIARHQKSVIKAFNVQYKEKANRRGKCRLKAKGNKRITPML